MGLSIEATAYHEAGHAVIALALGRPLDSVTIVPNQDRAGLCAFGKGTIKPTDDWLEREILIALGGIAAEARHTGLYAWDGAARDEQVAHSLAVSRAGKRRAARLQRRLLAKVENLLAQEGLWRAVELMAAELMRLGTISGRAARHFYEEGCDS